MAFDQPPPQPRDSSPAVCPRCLGFAQLSDGRECPACLGKGEVPAWLALLLGAFH
jgi:hypothetical protein